MSYPVQEEPYIQMMWSFVKGDMNAPAFVQQFFALRRQDGEKEWALRSTWDQPYDQLLSAALQRGDISGDEFSQRWDELFGWSPEEKTFLKLLAACRRDNAMANYKALRLVRSRPFAPEKPHERIQERPGA